jgi:VanZ family protein
MAAIFALSSRPSLPVPPGYDDKVAHAVAYGTLALAVLHGLTRAWRRRIGLPQVVLAIAVATLYGISDEWHQSFVPGRSTELLDLVADAVGAAAAAVTVWAWSILRPFRPAEASNEAVPRP